MKKMYLLFTLALLLGGVNAAYAKLVLGEQKTSFKAGDKVFFQGCNNINSGDSWVFGSWLYANIPSNPTQSTPLSRGGSETLPAVHDGYLFQLVDAKTSFEKDGVTYQGFHLYCPGIGKYVAANGSYYNFKKNIERAQVFYLINPKTYAIDFRGTETFETAYPGVQQAITTAFNLVTREEADGEGNGKDGYNYNAVNRAYGDNVALASYVDWAAWWYIFEGDDVEDVAGDLLALMAKVQPIVEKAQVGTEVGCIADQASFTALQKAYEDASAADAEVSVVYPVLQAAYDEFLSHGKNGFVALTEGYWRIVNADTRFYEQQQVKKAMFASGEGLYWDNLIETSKSEIWKITPTDDPTRFKIRNVATLGYLNVSGQVKTSTDSTVTCLVVQHPNLIPKYTVGTGGNFHMNGHSSGAGKNGSIVIWAYTNESDKENNASLWSFEPVENFTAEELENSMDQVVRNAEYTELLETAMNTYRIALGFLPADKDAGLIHYTPGEDEASNTTTYGEAGVWTGGTVWSNAKQGGEGSYGAMCDGIIGEGSAYFHTNWTGGPAERHYVQFNLDEPIENVAFYFARRDVENVSRRPSVIDVQVCADTLADNSGKWITVGRISDINYVKEDEEWTDENGKTFVGSYDVVTSGCSLFGSYRFIRFVVVENRSRIAGTNLGTIYVSNFEGGDIEGKEKVPAGICNGYPYITASEINILPVSLDPDCQMNALKNDKSIAPLITKLEEQITKAMSITDPTAEEMAELQQAYDDFVAVFPDPTPLTELIEKTQTYMGYMYVGSVPGTYESQDALDLNLLAVQQAIDEAQADIDGQTLFSKSQVETHIAAIEKARQALIDGARPIDFTKWVRLYLTREYWAKNPDLLKPDGWVENSAMYAPEDADSEVSYIKFDVFDASLGSSYDWRFIPVKGGYFIQNRATGKFIGESRAYESAHSWYPALSSVPAVFTVEPIGGGSFVIGGTTLDGGSVVEKAGYAAVHKYLHGAVAGQAVAYWESNDLGSRSGWEFEIQSADAFGDEADSEMENASVQKHLVPNRLYTGCYPTDVTLTSDDAVLSVYKVAGKNADESVIYLEQLEDVEGMVSIEAGTPFLYEVGEAGTDFTDYVESAEEESSVSVTLYYDFYPTLASEENDGLYVTEPSVEAGIVGLFEDQEVFKGHGLVSVYESGNAVVPYGLGFIEEDDETIETVMLRTTCYIAPSAARVLGADEVAGLKALPIAGKVDNAVAPVVGGDSSSALVDVYTIDGIRVRTGVSKADALKGLKSGLYIVNKQKVVVD